MSVPRVLVTRPEPAATEWARQLSTQGIAAEALPLIEIVPEPMQGGLARMRRSVSEYDAVMFVSGNAVAAFLHPQAGEPGLAQALNAGATRAWSPGPGTTEALLRAGWPARRIDAPLPDAPQFDSEALWASVEGQVRAGLRALIVRGGDARGKLAGRDWLALRLAEAGAEVEQALAYRRMAPAWTESDRARASSAAGDGSLWLFSSAEAIANLRACLPAIDWQNARALATHPRIAATASAAGFGTVRQTRPALADVMASIESLQ